ncbi:hypothetical protein CBE37_01260 [bacterium TMED277]|nr:MAG: hypothetical protein CBE37_01260 [bacterium TMED277]|tara:strand:- start:2717 stop:3532 length:816 start_codon:yes stop_codon:yes gene_type:complete
MNNLKMYCITINDNHINLINKIGYIPVGLGKKIKSEEFLRDNTKENISEKNPYYGEYTFHYWLWKNKMNELEDKWIGFCQYRKYWFKEKIDKNITDFNNFDNLLIKNISKEYNDYESILGEPFFVNQFRLSKFIKKNLKTMIKNPALFFNKDKRNLKFHFDMMHGHGNLSKAVNLLDLSERKDFQNFLENSVSFNPHNMFICRSKKILKNYYESLFPWLKSCEKVFGFDLRGYDLQRIYGFIAERYMSYWFQKYTKFKLMPIYFKDISDFN